MKLILITIYLLAAHSISGSALADSLTIEFTAEDSYSIEVARIKVGDKVEWLPTNEGHNVQFLAGPKKFVIPKESDLNKQYSVVFTVPGVYLYGCTPHWNSGMLGLVIVGNDFHNIEVIKNIKLSHVATSVLQRLIEIAQSK